MARIYLVCPVRVCPPVVRSAMDAYVAGLESHGHTVHYPPRDVDQANDDGAVRICRKHMEFMLTCDEVHLWFDETSYGCHFDAGMAVILHRTRGTRLVVASGLGRRPHKSFANFLRSMIDEQAEAEAHRSQCGLGKQVPQHPDDDCC